MLRAISSIYIESQAFELFATYRRDVYKLFRTTSTAPLSQQTVLTNEAVRPEARPPPPGRPPPPPSDDAPPPPPSPPRRAWTVAAAALALTASIGGVYFYRKLNDEDKDQPVKSGAEAPAGSASSEEAASAASESYPSSASELPEHVQYLLVGGGTASFAAMRAIRSAHPTAQVLIVGEELALPYMRPPLSKELWREPDPAAAERLEDMTFRQWNGKRRGLVYEPAAFYAAVDALRAGGGGAAAVRGWRVERLWPDEHRARLCDRRGRCAHLGYDKCLVATGVRARRLEALRAAREAGCSLVVRSAGDAAALARALQRPGVRAVAVLGGGYLASELSAALGQRLRLQGPGQPRVMQLYREPAPLARVLPRYLAASAAATLAAAGVTLRPHAEVVGSEMVDGVVHLQLASGERLQADLVLECVGSEPADELAVASNLETHPELGGVLVNAELQARSDVFAAGDVACFYDEVLGRRRVEHHDHAVVSGRLAGRNMAAAAAPAAYTHQSMFWSDLGPDHGYEAIGIIDSSLRTVGVFSADAVTDATPRALHAAAGDDPSGGAADPRGVASDPSGVASDPSGVSSDPSVLSSDPSAMASDPSDPLSRRYHRGVVLYLRDERVVGVLLWNLFNRMHVARQVLTQGHFEDLFEAAKLFALHDDD